MPADALDFHVEKIRCRQNRSAAKSELADGQVRHVVHAIDLVDAEALKQAGIHHGLCACAAFFCRLKDQDDSTGEIAGFRQIFRRSQQHGAMAVMTTGMHGPGCLGRVLIG